MHGKLKAFRSALVLSPGVAKVTIDPAKIEKFAVQASEKLFSFLREYFFHFNNFFFLNSVKIRAIIIMKHVHKKDVKNISPRSWDERLELRWE